MKAAWSSGRLLSVIAIMLVVLLCGVLAWEWEKGLQLESRLGKMRKLPVTAVPALKILPEFGLPDVETGFPELLSRPIFFSSRRAMASANNGAAGAMKRGQFVLVGVVITPDQHSALLRDVESGRTQTVAMGAQIQGVTLGEVEANKVVLRMGAESEELILKVQTAPRLPASPTQTPPAMEPPAADVRPAAAPLPTPPKELTAEERADVEKQNKAVIEARAKKGRTPPAAPSPQAAAK